MVRYIGIEAGGTKFVCVSGSGPEDIERREVFATQTPELTMPEVFQFIREEQEKGELCAIGAAVFGPLDLELTSKTYGHITTTPKLDWRWFDFVGALTAAFDLPIGFDTDVNAAALAEQRWGAGRDVSSLLYITVGTGIGAGFVSDGTLLHGAMHPEMGHMLIPGNQHNDGFAGVCPYHGCCLEGMASGPALKQRWGVDSALDLPPEHQAWDIEAETLAGALVNYTMVLSPHRIVMGGGVMRQSHLIDRIRAKVTALIAGYIKNPTVDDTARYIVKPELDENVGVCGALALAEKALLSTKKVVAHG
jgi:fructokinase